MSRVDATMLIGALVAAIPLGLLAGALTGAASPYDPTAIAATVSAILTLGGGALAYAGSRDGNVVRAIQAVGFIWVFCVCFAVAMTVAVDNRQRIADLVSQERLEAHVRLLEACSKAESFVNGARQQLGLEPLASAHFCPKAR